MASLRDICLAGSAAVQPLHPARQTKPHLLSDGHRGDTATDFAGIASCQTDWRQPPAGDSGDTSPIFWLVGRQWDSVSPANKNGKENEKKKTRTKKCMITRKCNAGIG